MLKYKWIIVAAIVIILIIVHIGANRRNEAKAVNENKKNQLSTEKENDLTEIAMQDKIENYTQLIEKAILLEKFLHGNVITSHLVGNIETDFYYDSKNNRIAFIPKMDEQAYYLSKLQGYERYSVGKYDLVFESLLDIRENKYLGTGAVNYDIDYNEYKLPELTEKDQEDIALVCSDIYQRLSARLDTFEYDVYIGDFMRGHNDDTEYVSMYIALVGDKRFYIWAEMKKNHDEYDIWLFPSPFLPLDSYEPLFQSEETYKEAIDNIVSLDEQIAILKKINKIPINKKMEIF